MEYPFTSCEVESIYYLPDGDTFNIIIPRALYTPSFLKTPKTNHEVDGIFIPFTAGKLDPRQVK